MVPFISTHREPCTSQRCGLFPLRVLFGVTAIVGLPRHLRVLMGSAWTDHFIEAETPPTTVLRLVAVLEGIVPELPRAV